MATGLDVIAQTLTSRGGSHCAAARVASVLGVPVPAERAARWLRRDSAATAVAERRRLAQVEAPTHRPDLAREVDLIEEVARLYGYDALPSRAAAHRTRRARARRSRSIFVRRLREAAAAAGLNEAINYAFVAPRELTRCARARTGRADRQSAIRGAFGDAHVALAGPERESAAAQHQQVDSFAQFELARVFRPRSGEPLPEELVQLGVLLWGERAALVQRGRAVRLLRCEGP